MLNVPPTTATPSPGARIIGATFAERTDAGEAVQALEEFGISPIKIQVVVQLNAHAKPDLYTAILADRGFAREEARHFDQLIHEGRTLVAVYDVVDPAPVIDILDHYHADLNPATAPNLRAADADKAAEPRE